MIKSPAILFYFRNKSFLDLFSFRYMGENKYVVVSNNKRKPDLDYFTPWEQEKMRELIEIYSNSSVTANDASDASHEKITAWKKTWSEKPNSIIDYKDPEINFEDNILSKVDEFYENNFKGKRSEILISLY